MIARAIRALKFGGTMHPVATKQQAPEDICIRVRHANRVGLLIGFFLAFTALSAAPLSPVARAVRGRANSPAPVKLDLEWTVIAGVEYAKAGEIAALLGLKSAWIGPDRKLVLSDKDTAIQLERDQSGAMVNGLDVRLGNAPILRAGDLYVSRIDLERSLLPRSGPALLGAPPARPKVIALDAGHGGKDHGTQNRSLKLREKVLTLDVVKRLKKLCIAAGFKVVLTRTGEKAPISQNLPLRAKVVNRARSDLMVSVHFNSLYPDTRTTGTETYVYTPRFQRSTRSLNAGVDDARKDAVVANRWDPWSALLADRVQRGMLARLNTVDRGQKTSHLLVLQTVDCPSVLVEPVFLSSDEEGRRAASPKFRQEIAAAIFDGIRSYVATLDELRS